MTQFPTPEVKLKTFTGVRSKMYLDEIIAGFKSPGMIVFSIVQPGLRVYLQEKAQEKNIITFDIISPLIKMLSGVINQIPLGEPGRQYELNENYFKRIEAVEFSIKHDDGQSPQNLSKADIVLIGLSRSSKTPLSMYLSYRGYKVANVPLVPNIEPPNELFQLDQSKVFALIIDADTLVSIRKERLKHMGISEDSSYAKADNVIEELRWVRNFYSRHSQWPVLNVSGRAIEESAAEILRIIREREQS